MRRVCLQAGHKGITTGATGAPGEREWTTKITPMIADLLRRRSIDVYETDANGHNDPKVTTQDYNLFLAIHYDADIYNDRGGFIDFADPSIDAATAESQRIAKVMREVYFPSTNIPERQNRSNINTRRYYMWSYLTAKTPCVLIEAGVGNRKPEDYNTLRNYSFIAEIIAKAICKALDIKWEIDTSDDNCCDFLIKIKQRLGLDSKASNNQILENIQARSEEFCNTIGKLSSCEAELKRCNFDLEDYKKKSECKSEKETIRNLENDIKNLTDVNKGLLDKNNEFSQQINILQTEISRLQSELTNCQQVKNSKGQQAKSISQILKNTLKELDNLLKSKR